MSFLLESGPGWLEGEIVVSADTAGRSAPEYGWPADDELLLYVIHGVLHLVGFDDTTPQAAVAMRERERFYLEACGVRPPADDAQARRDSVAPPDASGDVRS